MTDLKVPFKAFVLTPSFKVKEVEIVGRQKRCWNEGFISSKGQWYVDQQLFSTREAAIKYGIDYIHDRIASFEWQMEKQYDRRLNLEKERLKK